MFFGDGFEALDKCGGVAFRDEIFVENISRVFVFIHVGLN